MLSVDIMLCARRMCCALVNSEQRGPCAIVTSVIWKRPNSEFATNPAGEYYRLERDVLLVADCTPAGLSLKCDYIKV